jgi:hypothetical protein
MPERNRLRTPSWMWINGKSDAIYCYTCGTYGFLGHGTAGSVYYPKKGVDKCRTVYEPKPRTKGITYGQYVTRHIIHEYSSAEYHKEMERYKNHEIKSRPNGHQRRCYVHTNVKFQYNIFARCLVAFCEYNPYIPNFGSEHSRPYKGLTKIWKPTPKWMKDKNKPTKSLPPQERPLPLAVRARAL